MISDTGIWLRRARRSSASMISVGMSAGGAACEHVAQTELANIASEPRVFERDGKERRGGSDHALAIWDERAAFELHAQDADGAARHDQTGSPPCRRGPTSPVTRRRVALGKALPRGDLLLSPRVADKHFPRTGVPQQHPEGAGLRHRWEVVANGHSNGVVVDCPGKRLPKGHELFELGGAFFCRFLRRFRGGTPGMDVMAAGSPRVEPRKRSQTG